jgi:hypothetical protein
LVINDDLHYYAIKINATTFKLATTYDLAIAGTNDMTSESTLKWIERKDYGQLYHDPENMSIIVSVSGNPDLVTGVRVSSDN